MSVTRISISSRCPIGAISRIVTVHTALNGVEVMQIFDAIRSHGIQTGTTWSHGEETDLRDENATCLYFNTPPGSWKTNIVKGAVREVLALRPQA